MQQISFQTVVKDGYIKLPKKYSRLNDQKVVVEILNKYTKEKPKTDRKEKLGKFLDKYTGMLKNTGISSDIDIKKIKEMRLKEKYGI
jgi:hypothetical protein